MKESIKLDNGKYEVISHDNMKKFECTRYGESWRDLIGDNLMLSMFYRIKELEDEVKDLERQLDYKDDVCGSVTR